MILKLDLFGYKNRFDLPLTILFFRDPIFFIFVCRITTTDMFRNANLELDTLIPFLLDIIYKA